MTQFTPPRNLETVSCTSCIHVRNTNTKISQFFGINKYKGFENTWMSPMVITKVRQLGRFPLIVLIRIPEFVEIQAMIDNNSSKSFRSKAWNIEVFEFLISHEWRHSVFLIQYEKGQIFIIDKRKDRAEKLSNKLKRYPKPNIAFFCQDQMVNSQNNRWLALSLQDVPIVIVHHDVCFGVCVCWGGELAMVSLYLHSSLHKAYIKCLEEVMLLWIERVSADRSYIC